MTNTRSYKEELAYQMALRLREKGGPNPRLHENDMEYCEKLARVAVAEYCCPERRRLQVDCRYGLIHLDNDTNSFVIFSTFEGEDWQDTPPFQMEYCCFCGKKLQ